MKNKRKIILVILFLLSLFIIWNIRLNSKKIWQEKVLLYLENNYEGKFELINIKKESRRYIFSFITKDNNHISFDVKCWIGGYLTPWGEIPYIPQRHIVDDFPIQITNKYVDNTITYDMTNKTIEEIIKNLKALSKKVQGYYDLYGLSWQVPEINIKIKYNGKTEKIEYTNQNYSILHDMLIRVFY